MFEFFGKLMGVAVRSAQYMDVMISPMVWKLIVGEQVNIDDYQVNYYQIIIFSILDSKCYQYSPGHRCYGV